MKKILMVCLGNICRSPLAEGILQSKLSSQSFFVDSAGTAGYHVGELPDRRSIEVAKKYGIDITNQRSRKFVKSDFKDFDLIYAMDESNYNNIVSMTDDYNEVQKVKMIMNELYPNENRSVPDPYYGGDQGFENVYRMLDEACSIVASKLEK
ncbi:MULTISPECIES: low molecular weight protein-tyrosine-phosphatase [unclassified Tenacibaculum]|uniref:low molecular weight protein-tyrosine-phosphatase n=1 Tax=unclassified Tenacibaculum TaxID=2635139 RepID=UPI001F18F1D7|nr:MULTISPECIES: low molecular weight protein-tyrosine-phosphatase [unclassified Tenacibaculum]MCF2873962.1 low molecular weight phosphotyrosine protein phosphatase [Tenacibaculum sp. Cn5-1]MCF2934543.1 low molecular weight phosphotyrosine protein phosphatase [Tenacibaculum sp. Cn5-34]MCG7510753.1 low molecular weight phosphotyrosine protein phosphatase [Tenacibaculum sp. Cn5-46]